MSVSHSLPLQARSVPLFHLPISLNQKIAELENGRVYTRDTTGHIQDTRTGSISPLTQVPSGRAYAEYAEDTYLSHGEAAMGAEDTRENSTPPPLKHREQVSPAQLTIANESATSSKRSSRTTATFRALAIPRRTSSKIQRLLQPSLNDTEKPHRTALQQQQQQQQRSCQLFSSLDSTLALSQSRSSSAQSQPFDSGSSNLDSDLQKAPLSFYDVSNGAHINHRPAVPPTTPPRATSAASHRSNTSYYSLFPRACPTPPPRRMPHLSHSPPASDGTRERKASTTSSSITSSSLKGERDYRPSAKRSIGGLRSIWRSMMSLRVGKSSSSDTGLGTVRARGRFYEKQPPSGHNNDCDNGAEPCYRPRSSWSCMVL